MICRFSLLRKKQLQRAVNRRRSRLCLISYFAGRLSYHLDRSHDGKEQHPIRIKVATFSSGHELLNRFRSIYHVKHANAIIIEHTGLERTESLHL